MKLEKNYDLLYQTTTNRFHGIVKEKNNLIEKKNKLVEDLKLKEQNKMSLIVHYDEIFQLERKFNSEKRLLTNLIDKYKLILEMKNVSI